MLHDLLAQWPAYVAYLASFAYVSVIWVNHHQLFTRIARVNVGLLWRNLALLLTTSVLPFPTAVISSAFQLGDRADESAALAFYAAVGAAAAATWLLLFHFLSRTPRLLEDEAHAAFFARERHRAVAGVTLYAVSGLCAIRYPVAGLAIACVLPVFYGITSAGLRSTGPEALSCQPCPRRGPGRREVRHRHRAPFRRARDRRVPRRRPHGRSGTAHPG